jgi:hypothetical protein
MPSIQHWHCNKWGWALKLRLFAWLYFGSGLRISIWLFVVNFNFIFNWTAVPGWTNNELDPIHIEFPYYVHSVSSNLFLTRSTRCFTFLKSDHFFFFGLSAEIEITLSLTVIFTVSVIPFSSKIDFEKRIPLEFQVPLTFAIDVAILICYNTKL